MDDNILTKDMTDEELLDYYDWCINNTYLQIENIKATNLGLSTYFTEKQIQSYEDTIKKLNAKGNL